MELKCCPFCGNKEIHSGYLNYDEVNKKEYDWYVSCNNCDICFMEDTKEKAENKWNARVKESYNSVDIAVGDKRFCVVNDYPKYIVKYGTCKKISKHNDNSTKYTFKMNNYKTYTFTETSFGKKVFENLESAEDSVRILNKE